MDNKYGTLRFLGRMVIQREFRMITCINSIGMAIARVKKIVQANYPGGFQSGALSWFRFGAFVRIHLAYHLLRLPVQRALHHKVRA